MFSFGYGLSYTTFSYSNFKIKNGKNIIATFTVTNTGKVAGADVPQLYLTNISRATQLRLLGFERTELNPGESKEITLTIEPRLLANYDEKSKSWNIKSGLYKIGLGKSSTSIDLSLDIQLKNQKLNSK
ncbi:fibronectin type III-like domain-contianing protein [Chryseobacterium oryctis]|uniref:Fibronectin type III-like domain-contianing protein n=1 Tax=Chryseobacterium oryctis TaxID=2952618 RepID=A0ABT3HPZ4_9FLAO|nr:fibronectin type III-like domain-contianing protein [Chryseobacterium oryctis]MCW3161698.1 fibronectin type III-like domain-contianing protein [Chryseobacterium oryctis]